MRALRPMLLLPDSQGGGSSVASGRYGRADETEGRFRTQRTLLPHTLHFEHGMQALKHGCHVLMEKPMVTAADQAHEQLAEAVADLLRESGAI